MKTMFLFFQHDNLKLVNYKIPPSSNCGHSCMVIGYNFERSCESECEMRTVLLDPVYVMDVDYKFS